MAKKSASRETGKTELESRPGPQAPPAYKTQKNSLTPALTTLSALLVLGLMGYLLYTFFSVPKTEYAPLAIEKSDFTYQKEVQSPVVKKRLRGLLIRWKNPGDRAFKEVIVQKESGPAKAVIYRGTGQRCLDRDPGKNPRYRIITVNSEGYFSQGVVTGLDIKEQ